MSRLDIVDFIENFTSQLMQLTRFKILEFKRLFSLLCYTPPHKNKETLLRSHIIQWESPISKMFKKLSC